MLKLIIILALISTPLYAQEKGIPGFLNPSDTSILYLPPTALFAGPKPVQKASTEAPKASRYTFTTGTVGNQPIRTTTIHLNGLDLTTGTIGNEHVNVLSYPSNEEDED